MNQIKNFNKLTIEQLEEIFLKLIKTNKKLRERLAIYQEDIKHKENPHTAQEIIDFACGDGKQKNEN